MTAVASPSSFQQSSRSGWGANLGQGAISINTDDVNRMLGGMPRKSAQRANSSSSISSISSNSSTSSTSSTGTVIQPSPPPQTNGVPMIPSDGWGTAARKKPQRAGNAPWPVGKPETLAGGVSGPRQQSILTQNGALNSIHQPVNLTAQHMIQPLSQQANGNRPAAAPPVGEESPVLYLLSMNGTFERKTIAVPFYPDRLRIGRQTNAKTVPAPGNAFFDSKVLSRQHAEIWADRNGKVWIRDVKSSNGTFVNGARLSPEARESEPHELQTQDHLELGIDIVSEDQKTVVHHKVAAKVEHAGFLAPTNNVLDMNFGDLDPANGAMMVPSPGSMQMRARTASQGSMASNGRLGPPVSAAGSQMSAMGQQRPMNFWLTPVTTEQIVKRLNLEMRNARLQMNELNRTDQFMSSLLTKDDVKESQKLLVAEAPKAPQVNGVALPFRTDLSPRFSEPPAPPPQQPLPEKPDVARSIADPNSPSLKRANTERPRSVTSISPVREQNSSQIVTLVEALASAKKEIDTQGARLRDLEEMLHKERQAREVAEDVAKRLEIESELRMNGHAKGGDDSFLEGAFEPPTEVTEPEKAEEAVEVQASEKAEKALDPVAISDSSSLLEKQMELMLVEMKEMRVQMESFKLRAETAEAERDVDRKTLSEMVEKIRAEESARRSSSTERARSPIEDISAGAVDEGSSDLSDLALEHVLSISDVDGVQPSSSQDGKLGQAAVGIMSKPNSGRDTLLYNTTPYASMLGVVLVGMGLMAYLNGWQRPKVDG